MADPLRDGVAVFVKRGAQCIHQFRALMDKTFARPEQHRSGLLLFRPWLDETHLWTLCSDHNRLGIGGVILLAFY